MKFYIDQSGKIEQTNKNTVLCLSNDRWDSVLIKAKTKRQIQEIFRRHGRIRNYILFTFSAGISLLIKRNLEYQRIIIDREYFGKEAVIENIILEMIKKEKKTPEIMFDFIGKKAMAHHRGLAVAIGKLKAKKVITVKEILKEIKMTEVGKRLKNA